MKHPYRASRSRFAATAALLAAWLVGVSVIQPSALAQGASPILSAFSLKPSSVIGPDTTTATLTLNAAAPAGGVSVRLQSSSAFATVPAQATIAGGSTSATVTVNVQSVSAPSTVVIAASYGQAYRTATLSLNPLGGRPKIPQGGSASFRRSGTNAAGSGQVWDIYQGARFIANDTKPNGWTVTYDGSGNVFQIGASMVATVGQNYRVRYTSGSSSSALFDVIPVSGTFGAPTPGWAEGVVPTDSVPVGGAGPSAADSVDLATGALENNPGPDMVVRNPNGPDASYSRRYRTSRAAEGYGSPGLSTGWVDNYDLTIQAEIPGTWSNLRLRYPNGAMESLAVGVSGSRPSGFIGAPAGAPYFVTGTPSATPGKWTSIKITSDDESSMTFTPDPNAPSRYLLTKTTNLLGQSLLINYSASFGNRLNTVTDAASGVALLRCNYDLNGHLSSINDCYGRQVRFTFAKTGLNLYLATVTQTIGGGAAIGTLWTYGYTSINGQPFLSSVGVPDPTSPTSPRFHPIAYDTLGRVTWLEDANHNRRTYGYLGGRTQVSVLDSHRVTVETWTEKFSNLNASTGSIDAANAGTTAEYSDPLNPYQATHAANENGQSGYATYDSHGNVLTTIDSHGLLTTFTYDHSFPLGRLTSVKVGSKRSTRFHYYPNGMLRSVETPNPAGDGWVTTSATYTLLGNVATVTSPPPNNSGMGVTTRFNYTFDPLGTYRKVEALGEPVTVTDPMGNMTHFRYDDRGNITAVIDAEGNRTDYVYNYADQLIQEVYPATGQTGGGRAKTVYNYLYVEGPLKSIQILDESGAIARTVTSVLGNEGEAVKAKVNALTKESVGLDGQYRAGIFADGKSQKTKFTYDNVGNLSTMSYPGVGIQQFIKYDRAGNLLAHVNGRGIVTSLIRAADDSRVTDVKYSDTTPAQHYDYDIYGRVTHVADGTGTTDWTYDDLDNVLSVTSSYTGMTGSKTIFYSYFPDESRASMTAPQGTYSYLYDLGGRLIRVSSPWSGGNYNYTYDDADGLIQQHINKADTFYTLDAFGRVTELINKTTLIPPSTLSDFYNMTYDTLGNRTFMSVNIPAVGLAPSTSGTVTRMLDNKGRLTSEVSTLTNNASYNGNFSYAFTYDPAGNINNLRGTPQSYNLNEQINESLRPIPLRP